MLLQELVGVVIYDRTGQFLDIAQKLLEVAGLLARELTQVEPCAKIERILCFFNFVHNSISFFKKRFTSDTDLRLYSAQLLFLGFPTNTVRPLFFKAQKASSSVRSSPI